MSYSKKISGLKIHPCSCAASLHQNIVRQHFHAVLCHNEKVSCHDEELSKRPKIKTISNILLCHQEREKNKLIIKRKKLLNIIWETLCPNQRRQRIIRAPFVCLWADMKRVVLLLGRSLDAVTGPFERFHLPSLKRSERLCWIKVRRLMLHYVGTACSVIVPTLNLQPSAFLLK